jgi:DNA-binding IclR family transcriptional regulator
MTLPSAAAAADGGVRSVTRAFDLLRAFDAEHKVRSLRELVQLTGLPKSTVVRLLGTLGNHGIITSPSESTYSVGPSFLRWVKLAEAMWEVGAEARQVMTALRDDCGETVNIYIRQDLHRICVAQVEGTTTVRSVVRVGEPYSMTAGAAARVLLGGCPDTVLEALSAQDPHIDGAALRTSAAGAREAGFAITHGDRELGASAVAVPIVAADGRVLAALSLSGPTSRFTADRCAQYVEAVTQAARRISAVGLGTVEAFL